MFLAGDGDYTRWSATTRSNAERLWGSASRSSFPKDGINDHVIRGAATVNPAQVGTKAALHYVLTIDAGKTRGDPAAASAAARPTPTIGAATALELPPRRGRRLLRERDRRPSSPPTSGWLRVRRSAACSGASSSITTT